MSTEKQEKKDEYIGARGAGQAVGKPALVLSTT